jgi:hypothetical protein
MASLTPIDKKMLYYFRNESIGGAPERRRECIFDVSAHIRVDLCPSPGMDGGDEPLPMLGDLPVQGHQGLGPGPSGQREIDRKRLHSNLNP